MCKADTSYTTRPVCPYCGFKEEDWYDGIGQKYDGDSWDVDCRECDNTYTVMLFVEINFSTKKKEDAWD